ncbi:MAG: hypothetical protein QW597_02225 [Thermoplasmataceae archaeon]
MNYRVFLGMIEKEYTYKVVAQKMRGSPQGFFGHRNGDNDLKQYLDEFKKWFVSIVRTAKITGPDNVDILATDYIAYVALANEAIPPYRPLHPRIVEALKLFTSEELEHLFGHQFTSTFNRVRKGRGP